MSPSFPSLVVVLSERREGRIVNQHRYGIILPNQKSKEATYPEMIKSIHIQGYRGFIDFEMSGLQRVNLLVGTNNSGKTSALESLFLLASQGGRTPAEGRRG